MIPLLADIFNRVMSIGANIGTRTTTAATGATATLHEKQNEMVARYAPVTVGSTSIVQVRANVFGDYGSWYAITAAAPAGARAMTLMFVNHSGNDVAWYGQFGKGASAAEVVVATVSGWHGYGGTGSRIASYIPLNGLDIGGQRIAFRIKTSLDSAQINGGNNAFEVSILYSLPS